ncbi:MAG: hypothetical protein ACKVRP_03610 [Bacteroidota bacterium]
MVSFAALLTVLPQSVNVYRHFARAHFVECPEKHQQSTVAISAGIAATTSAVVRPVLVVTACALWPVGRRCSRKCIAQIRWSDS